ncbi:flagellar hook-length control protein FliK [Ferrimonas sp. SCSIO 43195]|uniref:flagellar hook-length control protein FliK n=1 Tax=Ferrimonas sp. SCSIO 43195 TaxID=2822844 RepID=UPI002075FD17|nr:flagellar hook-length control protein FliK [Ferrimonas sp. SCSIO 43195]USD36248.1 flagellar hook-length control protein FliK [Ferrimonas sp. SCSIO 43195]
MNAFPINLPGAATVDTGAGISANPQGQPAAIAVSSSPYSAVAQELTAAMTAELETEAASTEPGDSESLLVEGALEMLPPLAVIDVEVQPDPAGQESMPLAIGAELTAATVVSPAPVPETPVAPAALSVSMDAVEAMPISRPLTTSMVTGAEPAPAATAASVVPVTPPNPPVKTNTTVAAAAATATAAVSVAPVAVMPEQLEARIQLAAARSKALPVAAVDTAVANGGASQAPVSVWGPMTVTKSGDQALLAREMLAPLGDQIRFNLEQGIKRAEVRLDPPDLGRIELTIRQEGDRISVQLHAANPQVRDALAHGAERLRQEMMQQFDGQVDVDVGQQQPGQQQHPSQSWDERILAAEHHEMSRPEDEHDIIDMLA